MQNLDDKRIDAGCQVPKSCLIKIVVMQRSELKEDSLEINWKTPEVARKLIPLTFTEAR